MSLFILNDAGGIGSDDLDPLQAFVDMVIIADDDGVGMDDPVSGRQLVRYARTRAGAPQLRLDALVNTAFSPDYGSGAQNVDIVVIPGLSGFVLDDGTSFANNGTALPPMGSGLPGSGLNTTTNCLVIYDTQQNICVARDGTGGDIDLPISNPVVLYHEFSHAFRIVNNTLLALTADCDPSSPEENAAIVDENDLRTQIANRQNVTPELRDPGIHCGAVGCSGGCCIVATLVSRSSTSPQVQSLRCFRDNFVRRTEIGHAFFERFHRDYYAFSPQVCTFLAGNPRYAQHMLDGFVDPLLDFWRVMIERSNGFLASHDLGRVFIDLHPDRALAERRAHALRRTREVWLRPDPSDPDVPMELIGLLQRRAWPSPYIRWALVEPVLLYGRLLDQLLDGADATRLGALFDELTQAWVSELPISDVWSQLSVPEIADALRFCDEAFLQSPASRERFRDRLRERFPDVTAIAEAVDDDRHAVPGGVR